MTRITLLGVAVYSVRRSAEHRVGNSVIFSRLKSLPETLKSVFTMFVHFPKLDVAGSSPVSRSKTTTYRRSPPFWLLTRQSRYQPHTSMRSAILLRRRIAYPCIH
jgi:hypothetical protein